MTTAEVMQIAVNIIMAILVYFYLRATQKIAKATTDSTQVANRSLMSDIAPSLILALECKCL